MGQLQKLTKQHVDEIYRLAATGKGSTEIAAGLEEGLVTDSGDRLSCVCITPAGVRHHLNQPKAEAAIREWRQQLYGDIYAEPLAWAGCRLQELAELYRHAKSCAVAPAETKQDEVARQRWARVALESLGSIRAEISRIEPEAPRLSAHLHMTSSTRQETVSRLARDLAGVLAAGGGAHIMAQLMDTANHLEAPAAIEVEALDGDADPRPGSPAGTGS